MSINKYKPHVWLIPEDEANRQLAIGFLNHVSVSDGAVGVRAPAGGWSKVLGIFESEYLPLLRQSNHAHVVMLIDFDEVEGRRDQFEQKIPKDVSSRVFVVGSKDEPETLKHELDWSYEKIGRELAEGCHRADLELWHHAQLIHNASELQRMADVVKPILFKAANVP